VKISYRYMYSHSVDEANLSIEKGGRARTHRSLPPGWYDHEIPGDLTPCYVLRRGDTIMIITQEMITSGDTTLVTQVII
jgi:hypothetical protein